jgi:valyl-tRNA synthetase
VRKAKSEAKVSMRADVSSTVITANPDAAERLAAVEGDLQATGRIHELSIIAADGPILVEVVLA